MLILYLYRKYGEDGLPKGKTINITLKGSAGQSFCAFMARGVNVTLEGDANDYVGKWCQVQRYMKTEEEFSFVLQL